MNEATSKRAFKAERDFGLVVGTVVTLLGAWWLYRDKFPAVRPYFLGIGVALIALGILFPRLLVLPNRAWMALAEVLSWVMTRVVLAVVYFLIVTPIGVVKRLTGWDPLNRRAAREGSYWRPYPERQQDARHYEKMY